MNAGYFITGTDTNSGKTWVTVSLMRKFRKQGLSVVGMKPVAAGCQRLDGRLTNPDALLIQENCSFQLSYEQINPYAFTMPVSPHIACGDTVVDSEKIMLGLVGLWQTADVVIVEGAGGWLSPLGKSLDNASLAQALQLPVILVVGMRLGCINHARLTAAAVTTSMLPFAGWVGVELSPDMPGFHENLDYLMNSLDAPLLGVLPYSPGADFDGLSEKFNF